MSRGKFSYRNQVKGDNKHVNFIIRYRLFLPTVDVLNKGVRLLKHLL